ncbi:hypothetical protein EVAR_84710_1 [Eumeta japonica]|uniref:Uncharacterized protein n=1 Tax=Eumeta variegata TaxID=151549 RepID=A0A4C1VSQ6_EUMVA|nr:hypothetical protein EVAR_84710_1 [Eumeta japonica]
MIELEIWYRSSAMRQRFLDCLDLLDCFGIHFDYDPSSRSDDGVGKSPGFRKLSLELHNGTIDEDLTMEPEDVELLSLHIIKHSPPPRLSVSQLVPSNLQLELNNSQIQLERLKRATFSYKLIKALPTNCPDPGPVAIHCFNMIKMEHAVRNAIELMQRQATGGRDNGIATGIRILTDRAVFKNQRRNWERNSDGRRHRKRSMKWDKNIKIQWNLNKSNLVKS